MATLQDELEWERSMIDRGIERYKTLQEKAADKGQYDQVSSSRRLLSNYIQQAADNIELYISGQYNIKRPPEWRVIKEMDPFKVAYIGMKQMMRCIYIPNSYLVSICSSIGKRIEDEFNFNRLEVAHSQYYDAAMQALADKNSNNARYKARAVIAAAQKAGKIDVDYWDKHQKVAIGLIVFRLIHEVTDLFEIRISNSKFLIPKPGTVEWVHEHDDAMSMLFPDRMPTLIPPQPWTSFSDGGFYLPELRAVTPFVITNKLNPKKRKYLYNSADMPEVYKAVSTLQNTAWCINKSILKTMKEVWAKNLEIGMPRSEPYEFPKCPLDTGEKPKNEKEEATFKEWKHTMRTLYSMEAQRVSKAMQFSRDIKLAQLMTSKEKFYFVYRCDFRGRFSYAATTGLSPQGADQSRALLQFFDAKPLGETGAYWFKVHGANKYGEDKKTFDDRVQWIEERKDWWLAVANDPLANSNLWRDADSPYQFLAWCLEYKGYIEQGNEFQSRLPIAKDGSCNGLQHFSAMLKDEIGGRATNLIPQDSPSDIYAEVAKIATDKLKEVLPDAGAKNWLWLFNKTVGSIDMPRKLSKKPVMTLPYGSTQRTCTQSIYDWYVDNCNQEFGNKGFAHAVYLTPYLWGSIGNVVRSAREAMSWIQKCSSIIAKTNSAFYYTTPLGFPVYHKPFKMKAREVKTSIDGFIRVVYMDDSNEMDINKTRNSSSPNFVHCMDATHMMMTINAAHEQGIEAFAMVHDDYGCHACDIETLDKVTREQFIKLYTERDPLMNLKEQLEAKIDVDLPDPPAKGTLDITEVKNSKYFFS